MFDINSQVAVAVAAIRQHWPATPRVGIILGSGLGRFAQRIAAESSIPFATIPHFPRATADGHKGQLVCGTLGNVPIVAMEGRCHAYEGYSLAEITLPVRVMHALGIELLIVSNASGGMNPRYAQGDIVVIVDHINMMLRSPLAGPHDESWGARHVDLCRPYDPALVEQALAIARREDFAAHPGVYVSVRGPNLETRAEYRFFRAIGGDVIGMSTVPEVIVATQLGLRVLALAIVTNVCLPDAPRRASGDEIVVAADAAEPKLRKIVLGVVGELASNTAEAYGRRA